MERRITVADFPAWRTLARELIWQGIRPEDVDWLDARTTQPGFDFSISSSPADTSPATSSRTPFTISQEFLDQAKFAACHRNPKRWSLLYRMLWRLVHGESQLLEVAVDEDVHELNGLVNSVRRDEHKMHAFVRFQKMAHEGLDQFVAWYRPDHYIVQVAAPFFVERFHGSRWTIMTPHETAIWNGETLGFGPGVRHFAAPHNDEVVNMWRSYYASTFNPARLNVRTMRREMPARFWPHMPEAAMIPELVAGAATKVTNMVEAPMPEFASAAEFLPEKRSIKALTAAAEHCRGCDLYKNATQTVFGLGPAKAKVVFVGEQPGDQEDLAGEPFIGPAGKLLDSVLDEVGIDRSQVYVTNAVKHFKWTPRGKRRMHAKPSSREMAACRPWLEAEFEAIHPQMLVCLGATAAQSLLGRTFKLTQRRGEVFASDWADWTLATYHPSAILRTLASDDSTIYDDFRKDMSLVAKAIHKLG